MVDYGTQLEKIIDDVGMAGLLDMMVEVCLDKANHVMAHYDDYDLECSWGRTARLLDRAARKAKDILGW
jgi:hypothetical protein